MPHPPTSFDPTSADEQAPPPPSAPPEQLSPRAVLQPPLSRRGAGPGLILLLPDETEPSRRRQKPLDPDPVQKWAEEGFAVVAITGPPSPAHDIADAVEALKKHAAVDAKDKIGIVSYGPLHPPVPARMPPEIVCVAAFAEPAPSPSPVPTYFHACGARDGRETTGTTGHASASVSWYPNTRRHFVLPGSAAYSPAPASLAHTRNLAFLKKHIGGPVFDIEAVWEEHTRWEFERRSVAQTMATMVVRARRLPLPVSPAR
ncbi:carboxymethylenebutenolidase [Metarhizium album ARSEF 1941]|uniref:Carboxymethylenebutenolidase n=1 Tax=Metarhizium album (strain ARSEF 1941) TaxID=1081103 RepID=A0A0B2WG29_METAS|nr:carboxymethylenebutenolidase [Metarhizium album ARSEF 1941]KHN94941.1 carboxymethylenebutenolidase [Metarhizium album ARSEF 1941]